jgi:cell division protein FtsX
MSYGYYFHRSAVLLRRRMSAFLRIVLASALLTVAVLSCMAAYFGLLREQHRSARSLEITAILKEDRDSIAAYKALEQIKKIPWTEGAYLISPNDASKEFDQQIGTSSSALLPINPFPWSVAFHLKPEYCTYQFMSDVIVQVRKNSDISETLFNSSAAGALFARNQNILTLGFAGAAAAIVLFLGILSYVFRAELLQSSSEWFVLRTLGATRRFIAFPHLLFGFYASGTGTLTGLAISLGIVFTQAENIPWLSQIPIEWPLYSLGIMLLASGITATLTAMTATRNS